MNSYSFFYSLNSDVNSYAHEEYRKLYMNSVDTKISHAADRVKPARLPVYHLPEGAS